MDPRRQRWIAGGLGVLALLVWVRPGRSRPPVPHGRAQAMVERPSPSSVSPPRVSRYPEWGDNPFLIQRGSTPTPTTPAGRVLSGILWDPETPVAIVNGRVVRVGDWVGKWQVAQIQQDRVVLSSGPLTETLTVESSQGQ